MSPEVARTLRGVLAEVVEQGTARRLAGSFVKPDGTRVVAGGKTGSGDNRFKTFNRAGGLTSSRAVNRTATFVFYIGDRYFGVMTSFVPGQEAEGYSFTSALSVSILKLLAPVINARLGPPSPIPDLRWAQTQRPGEQPAGHLAAAATAKAPALPKSRALHASSKPRRERDAPQVALPVAGG